MPSLVAEIDSGSDHQKQFLAQKRREFVGKTANTDFPEQSTLRNKCNTKAMVLLDNCMTPKLRRQQMPIV